MGCPSRLVREPKLAADLVNHVKNSPGVNEQQRRAVEQGLAEALTRLKAVNQLEDGDWGVDPLVIAAVVAALVLVGVLAYYAIHNKDKLFSPN
jgi:hypothetical protein